MKYLKSLSVFLLVTLIISCDAITGEEVARVSFEELSVADEEPIVQTTTVELKAGDGISLWASMNLEYEGPLGLEYRVMVIREQDTLGVMQLDPFDKDMTIGEVKTQFGNKTKWKFTGRMRKIRIDEDGLYEFYSLLIGSDNPTLQLKKADLMIKK